MIALATAAAVALSPTAANATNVVLTPNTTFGFPPGEFAYFFTSGGISGPIDATFGHQGIPGVSSVAGTAFTDMFNFIINDNGVGSGSVTTSVSLQGKNGATDTDLLSVFINGILATHTVDNGLTDQWSVTDVPIYFGVVNNITINGISRGQGHYAGTAEFTPVAAVPEPATWAMMLLGFGVVGFSMRRKRKTVLIRQFA
ncbi:FxDxF family PEP-CTERM protein [Sphingomonas limnosediminicola]